MLPDDPSGLETAVALYRGEFLAGFQISKAAIFEEWVTIQRQSTHLLAIEALQRLVEHHIDSGSYDAGIPQASRLLMLDPWREETHRNLMLLLFLKGEINAALQQYEQCRQILSSELGVTPSAETETLYRNIRSQIDKQIALDTESLALHASLPIRPVTHNIPSQPTKFIGREIEQRAIDIVLGDQSARLVTIFGVGGSGKTRLALAIGEKQRYTIRRDG